MRRKILLGLVSLLVGYIVFTFAFSLMSDSGSIASKLDKEFLPIVSATPTDCNADGPYTLADEAFDVDTTNGELTLPIGTEIGGSPYDYIVTTVDYLFDTTSGNVECSYGTKIDCDHEPWEPDPCTAS